MKFHRAANGFIGLISGFKANIKDRQQQSVDENFVKLKCLHKLYRRRKSLF